MIPFIAVVEGLTKVLELMKNSKEFFGKFESDRRRIFTNQIEPAFEGLRPVIRCYGDIIAAFREAISNSPDYAAAEKAITECAEARRKTVRDRTELISTLRATRDFWLLKGYKPEPSKPIAAYVEFLSGLEWYFESYSALPTEPSTMVTDLLDAARRTIGDKPERTLPPAVKQALLDRCDYSLAELEVRHNILYRRYADLRLASLGAGSPLHKS
jgi:hypothetical protein